MSILVTGSSKGLGRAIASRLTQMGKPVIAVTRDDADLSRMDEVRRLAEEIASRNQDLEVLINNAGVSKFAREVTPDGFETTFATNYLTPFLLSNLLLPVLARNKGAVINVGSEQHRWVRAIPWDDLQGERRFQPIEQYSLTKLYLVLFTRELARRSPDVAVSCVSPGFLRTDLGRDAKGFFRVFLTLARPLQQSPERGSESVIHAMEARATGAYFRGRRQVTPSKLALDDAVSARLWELSAKSLDPAHLR
jgi:NAD(P)-dependent dehydrogenase (short-subunit alcohol dehydrogenase family)